MDDIQCEEERVKVRFLKDCPWADYSYISDDAMLNSENVMERGTITQLPLWLARPLHLAGYCQILPPRHFGARVRADLAADASAINLANLSRHWYRLGMKVAPLLPSEGIAKVLRGALSARIEVLSKALHSTGANAAVDPHKTVFGAGRGGCWEHNLDVMERTIFRQTIEAKRDSDRWTLQRIPN